MVLAQKVTFLWVGKMKLDLLNRELLCWEEAAWSTDDDHARIWSTWQKQWSSYSQCRTHGSSWHNLVLSGKPWQARFAQRLLEEIFSTPAMGNMGIPEGQLRLSFPHYCQIQGKECSKVTPSEAVAIVLAGMACGIVTCHLLKAKRRHLYSGHKGSQGKFH